MLLGQIGIYETTFEKKNISLVKRTLKKNEGKPAVFDPHALPKCLKFAGLDDVTLSVLPCIALQKFKVRPRPPPILPLSLSPPLLAHLAPLYHQSILEQRKIGFKVTLFASYFRVSLLTHIITQDYHCATSITVSNLVSSFELSSVFNFFGKKSRPLLYCSR